VCIVTYKARDLLRECLHSLYENTSLPVLEVIVVDNGSQDGVGGMVKQEYPAVQFIGNEGNAGYTRPMNQALRLARGRYLVQLNPDTLILPNALDQLVGFMDSNIEVGICSPKVLNRDHTLQKSCRRGEPRPWAMVSYFLGLSTLFPRSRFFGGYHLNYMDENAIHEVAGVSGSCMLIRREVIDQIGYLDERFFAYQEDADFCYRARQAGWRIYYMPQAQIIHYGGQGGSRVEPYRSIVEWHKSYWLYYRKHLAKDYFFFFNWIYYFLMFLKLCLALATNFLRKEKFAGPRR
jgi:GT2 family glycosyltransferase